MNIFKFYEIVSDQEFSISVYYSKDYKRYVMSVIPVKREEKYGYTIESFEAYSGMNVKLLDVNIRSKKNDQQAIEFMKQDYKTIINMILYKQKTAQQKVMQP